MTPTPAQNPVPAMTPDAEGQLRAENSELRARLEEAEDTLRAIRTGEIDSLVVETPDGPQVFTLASADAASNRFRGEILAEVSDAVIAVDADQRVTYLNAAAERQYRVSAGDVLGHQLSQIFTRQWPSAEAEAATWAALREQGEWRGEVIHRTHDGREIPVESSLTLLRDLDGTDAGMVSAIRDITDRTRAEEASRESEHRFRIMADGLPLVIWVHDARGQLQFVNQPYCEFFGVTPEQVAGPNWQPLVHPDDVAAYASAFSACVRDRRPFHAEVRARRFDGEWRWLESRAQPRFSASGEFLGMVGSSPDITERNHAEAKLRQIAAELSESDRRKSEFLAMLAHELRNPLAPIRNMLQVLKLKGDDQNAVSSASQVIERQVGQMVRLVDDLLDVSRVSRGKIELRKERIGLASIIRQAEEAASPHCQSMNHELTVTLPSRPVEVDGDPVRLIQVVTNLLTNASKFTDAGGRIWLSVEGVGEQAVIRVRDNGIGINADNLPRLFQIFMQADTSLDRPAAGLGLGLALVKNLVEMHSGTVEVHSEGIGRGSEFVVRLPLLPDAPIAETPEPVSTAATENAAKPSSAKRILVVDDNRDSADSMAMILQIDGYATHTAYDGLQALEVAASFRPDVVLLDIGLPGLNGYEACRRIREQASGRPLQLVALTGWGQDEDRKKTAEAGFDVHLVKPVDYDQLLKLLA